VKNTSVNRSAIFFGHKTDFFEMTE